MVDCSRCDPVDVCFTFLQVLAPSIEAEADFCFQLFDKDGSGKLDKSEVRLLRRVVRRAVVAIAVPQC